MSRIKVIQKNMVRLKNRRVIVRRTEDGLWLLSFRSIMIDWEGKKKIHIEKINLTEEGMGALLFLYLEMRDKKEKT
jgi:hypothetical protein